MPTLRRSDGIATGLISALILGGSATAFTLAGGSALLEPLQYEAVPSGLPRVETVIAAPNQLIIPALDIVAHVESVGAYRTGRMRSPSNFFNVAWYQEGPRPGEAGNAVIAGHLDNALGLSGVFKDLDKLLPGDDVYVATLSGEEQHFKVVRIAEYHYTEVPINELFGTQEGINLNLVTCAGIWIKREKTYDRRLVVYTQKFERSAEPWSLKIP